MKRKSILLGALLLMLIISGCQPDVPASPAPNSMEASRPDNSIAGTVMDETNMPVAGAIVRIKATDFFTTTDARGEFVLDGLQPADEVLLTAWAEGYYIGGGLDRYVAGDSGVKLILKKHAGQDNPDYEWVSAFAEQGMDGNCENCHFDPVTPQAALPFVEWSSDAHALAAGNERFLTMYLGQDAHGSQSPLREYGFNRDYGRIPLRPDPGQPYFGPGYKLDFPETDGNCAACHAPAAAINAPYETDPTRVTGVGAEGVSCDFCHKVWSVRLDASGRPQSNMPGVLSFEFRRPFEDHQFFAGPFDDVAPGEDTFSPVQQQSQFCAPCHFGSFWGTQVYNSFGEWLESPYSDPVNGRTCQDCHMPPGNNDHFARLDKGGVLRAPQTIFSHRMPGAGSVELLQNAVTLTAAAQTDDDQLVVDVQIYNDRTGHHIPTDSPLRQLILLVSVIDDRGQTLPQLGGETLPEWAGMGDPKLGYYAGLPGKGYAKVLSELWTEMAPTGSYWNPTRIVSDNRIAAFETDASRYTFALSENSSARVKISLIFRRAFKELMDQKGWDVPDIVLEEVNLVVP